MAPSPPSIMLVSNSQLVKEKLTTSTVIIVNVLFIVSEPNLQTHEQYNLRRFMAKPGASFFLDNGFQPKD